MDSEPNKEEVSAGTPSETVPLNKMLRKPGELGAMLELISVNV